MASSQGAQTLAEAYRLLDPLRPLEEWLDRFYAERPEAASIQPLVDELPLDDREDDKTLLTGHRGSGKTTELACLEGALAPTHIVVRMDIEGLLNLGDVDYADLLVVMGLQVFRQAHRSGVRLAKDKLDGLRFWYQTHILEEDERRVLDEEVEATLNVGIASITASLRTNTPRRRRVRAEAQTNLADLLARLNDLLDELRKKAGKRILIIVDGLDKMFDLKQVCALFLHGANALLEPRCRVVYTVPISLYYTNDFPTGAPLLPPQLLPAQHQSMGAGWKTLPGGSPDVARGAVPADGSEAPDPGSGGAPGGTLRRGVQGTDLPGPGQCAARPPPAGGQRPGSG